MTALYYLCLSVNLGRNIPGKSSTVPVEGCE